MKNKSIDPLAVTLYGMDGRAKKTMTLFIQGSCKGIARIVDEPEANVDIIDADAMDARVTLEHCLARKPLRPIIILSLEKLKIEHTIFVEKPVKAETMLAAFKETNDWLKKGNKKTTKLKKREDPSNSEAKVEPVKETKIKPSTKTQTPFELATEKKIFTNPIEQQKRGKHKAATMINERNFSSFIGIVSGVDFNDSKQWRNARYNPKHYYQGYVQSAIQVAYKKKQIIKLSSAWKPLIIFPYSHECWLNADDQQLRAFAGVEVNSMPSLSATKTMTLSRVDPKQEAFSSELDKFQEMNAFVWKLACWTSKGRYPLALNLTGSVYLKQWPNFTRLLITPHAMRIAALLIAGPRTVLDIIRDLRVKPQYVFIFISATYAIGILEQAKKQADDTLEHPKRKENEIITTDVSTTKKSVKKKSIFSRILNKLRG